MIRLLSFVMGTLYIGGTCFIIYLIIRLFHLEGYIKDGFNSFKDYISETREDNVKRVYILDNIRENIANASEIVLVFVSKIWNRFKRDRNYSKNHYEDVEYHEIIDYDKQIQEKTIETKTPKENINEEDFNNLNVF